MSSTAHAQVARLYVALFGRAPDADGLAYWTSRIDSGETVAHVADAMYATTPARAYFPDGTIDGAVIASFYENVLGRTADIVGLSYWTLKLGVPGATRGSVLAEMVDVATHYTGTDPAGLTSAALFTNRSAAALFYGENGGSIEHASEVLSGVTTDPQTLLPARVLAEGSVSGTIDVGGFTDVRIGTLADDVVLRNVVDGATLHLADTSHRVTIDSLEPAWMDGTLTITLPEGPLAENLLFHLPNYADITLNGFDELHVSSANEGTEVVYLRGANLDELVLSGSGHISFMDPSGLQIGAAHVDATGFSGTVEVDLAGGAALEGGTGADTLWGWSSAGATIDGGLGNDFIGAGGAITMLGGGGHDTFAPAPFAGASDAVIADFQKGSDSIYLYQLVTNHSAPVDAVISNWGTWYSQQIFLGADATYGAYLDAAAATKSPAATYAAISWFQHDGDTYLVVDNSTASTFQPNTDYVVKLMGLIDLGTATYDAHTAILS